MPQYNDMFELSVEDIDLIETALHGYGQLRCLWQL